MNGLGFFKILLYLSVTFDCAEFYTTFKKYCTLPEGNTARCKAVEECEPIMEYLNSTKLSRREIERKLIKYSCEYNRREQITNVCCPPGSLIVTDDIPPPPDVTNHTNLYLLPEDCGFINIEDKIRNGQNAGLTEFPWMALLSYNTSSGPNFQCGATIINDRYVLTAAHCVEGLKHPLIGVRVGEYNLRSISDCEDEYCLPSVQNLAIEKVIIPEDYNATLHANDIALLRVTKIDLEPANAKPVCLPIHEEIRNREISKGVVTGWGFIDPVGTTASILQKVILERRDISVCKKYYGIVPSIKLSFKQLCIGGQEKKDSCRGDSGGPFQIADYFNSESRYVQFGIVSFGPGYCGYEGAPGVYTLIPYFMDWILDNLEP